MGSGAFPVAPLRIRDSGSEGITRNSVEMEFHPFQSKELVSEDPFFFRGNHGAERDKGGGSASDQS